MGKVAADQVYFLKLQEPCPQGIKDGGPVAITPHSLLPGEEQASEKKHVLPKKKRRQFKSSNCRQKKE